MMQAGKFSRQVVAGLHDHHRAVDPRIFFHRCDKGIVEEIVDHWNQMPSTLFLAGADCPHSCWARTQRRGCQLLSFLFCGF